MARWTWSFLLLVAIGMALTMTSQIVRLPTGARGYYNRGIEDTRLGHYETALTNLDRAIALEPSWPDARVARAAGWMRAGRPYRALVDADAALALSPRSPRAHLARGLALRDLGRYDEAEASLRRAFSVDVAIGRAALAEGDLDLLAGRYGKALSAYREARSARKFDASVACVPMLIWTSRTLEGDRTGADTELRSSVAASLADRPRLAPWAALATAAPAQGESVAADDRAVAEWISAVLRLAAGDSGGAIEHLKVAAELAPAESWVGERAARWLDAIALGFTLLPRNTDLSPSFSFGAGLEVGWVRAGGPASDAGLTAGDRVVRIDGVDASPEAPSALARRSPPGARLPLVYERDGLTGETILVVGGAGVTPAVSEPTR